MMHVLGKIDFQNLQICFRIEDLAEELHFLRQIILIYTVMLKSLWSSGFYFIFIRSFGLVPCMNRVQKVVYGVHHYIFAAET
jgi:hypothetical protein